MGANLNVPSKLHSLHPYCIHPTPPTCLQGPFSEINHLVSYSALHWGKVAGVGYTDIMEHEGQELDQTGGGTLALSGTGCVKGNSA